MSLTQAVSVNQLKNLIQPPVTAIKLHHNAEQTGKALKLIFASTEDAENYMRNIKNFFHHDLTNDPDDSTKQIVLLPEAIANEIYNRTLVTAVRHELMQQEKAEKKE